ncbi:MAG: HAMP domain-containing protein [Verrucomicrobia bacterium]|nr:HAMP domain-containing protein [Verrucomicrobiota bacterium]
MTTFRNLTIGQKVGVLIAGACALTVLVAGLAIGGSTVWWTRKRVVADFTVRARMLAANTAAAVVFDDRRTAEELLATLRFEPRVVRAVLFRPDGSIFARHDRDPEAREEEVRRETEPIVIVAGRLLVTEPVRVEEAVRGTLLLDVDYALIRQEVLRPQLILLALILPGTFVLAVLSAAVLRNIVARPLRDLARTADRIAVEGDYSVRAPETGRDEVGQLSRAFNTMLRQVETANRELSEAHARLSSEMTERLRLQGALVTASREAGMAEVATGVLHNVGNVLNSVNVATNLLRERLDRARVGSLQRTVGLLRAHEGDLAEYVGKDPQGRQVLGFLEQVTQHLVEENAAVRGEIEGVCRHVDHIKEIVAMQQSYAKPGGVLENVNPAEVFDEAVRIKEDSCRRHRIRIERDYAALPPMTVDRHRVIQILVNLLSNAVTAIKAGDNPERRLSLQLAAAEEGRVRFVVRDTGVGIPPEHLTKICGAMAMALGSTAEPSRPRLSAARSTSPATEPAAAPPSLWNYPSSRCLFLHEPVPTLRARPYPRHRRHPVDSRRLPEDPDLPGQ